MVGFTHGGTGTGQGEELMRDFGTRATEGSQAGDNHALNWLIVISLRSLVIFARN